MSATSTGHSVWLDLLDEAERRQLQPGVPERFERRPDVLVVGGGILGLATAAACVQARLGSVVLIERERLGAGPTGGAAALLVPSSHFGDPPPHAELGRVSLAVWRDLHADWPGGVGLVDMDWLSLSQDPFGSPTDPPGADRLSADEVARLAPDLAEPHAGVLVKREARINPLRTLAMIASRLPCVATGVEARGVTTRGDRLSSVETNYGSLEPNVVVFATGLAPSLDGLRLELPQTEVKGHMLATEPTHVRLPGTVEPFGTQIEDNRLITGGELTEGFETREIQAAIIEEHWNDLVRGFPGLKDTRLSHQWCCFRPAHPDRLPVIDRIPGTSNAWMTSGHFRTGILMAAGTGRVLAEWIESGQRPALVSAFGIDRFSSMD
jgi:glycine oxidase